MCDRGGGKEKEATFETAHYGRYLRLIIEYFMEGVVLTSNFYRKHQSVFREYGVSGVQAANREIFDVGDLEQTHFLATLITSTDNKLILSNILSHLKEGRLNPGRLQALTERLSHHGLTQANQHGRLHIGRGVPTLLAVFGWKVYGDSTEAIRTRLQLSPQTVKNSASAIFEALLPENSENLDPQKRLELLQQVAVEEGYIVERS